MLDRRRLLRFFPALLADTFLRGAGFGAAGCAQIPPHSVSVKRFGAIGDGASHPISEWVPSRYKDLRAIQADYPDARRLTDEIDFVAINKAVRIAAAAGLAVELPAGTYRAWIYVHSSGVSLVGAGSDRCRIRLPDGANHSVVPEDRSLALTGTPCVIEAGVTAEGNRAAAFSGLRITGLTLDGNAGTTPAPRRMKDDIFGWGLACTNYSDVYYRDIVAIDCHAGGVGTFINSDRHDGEAHVERCGLALQHPGFDINSSHDGRWRVTVRDCPYGVRMLDNCWNSKLEAEIDQAGLSGLVCDNQSTNESYRNSIIAVVRGGCRNSGAQIGDGWSRCQFDLSIEGVDGVGVNSGGTARSRRGEHDNSYRVATKRCGQQSVVIAGRRGDWIINSESDGALSAVGSVFALDVYGSDNTIKVSLSDSKSRWLRGIVCRKGALRNAIQYTVRGTFLESANDQEGGNKIAKECDVPVAVKLNNPMVSGPRLGSGPIDVRRAI